MPGSATHTYVLQKKKKISVGEMLYSNLAYNQKLQKKQESSSAFSSGQLYGWALSVLNDKCLSRAPQAETALGCFQQKPRALTRQQHPVCDSAVPSEKTGLTVHPMAPGLRPLAQELCGHVTAG